MSLTLFGSSVGGLECGLLERGGHDLLRQVQVFAQVFNAIVGQVPVVVLPGEAFGDVAARRQRLQCFDDVQIWHGHFRVIHRVEVLLGNHDALGEQVFVDGRAVFLGH